MFSPLVEEMTHNLPLVVLAGGFGTRLRSIVSDRPKPMAPIRGTPFLQFLLEKWVQSGVCDFIFLLHYQARQLIDFLQTLEQTVLKGCSCSFVVEPQPMGTGGAVAHAIRQTNILKSFMVVNADTWLSSGISVIRSANASAIAVVAVADTSRYGSVTFDEQGRVTEFREKKDSVGAGWINAGLYHLEPEWFFDWDGQPFSLEKDLFPKLAHAGKLCAVPLHTEFIDIGIPEDYRRFLRWIESGRAFSL